MRVDGNPAQGVGHHHAARSFRPANRRPDRRQRTGADEAWRISNQHRPRPAGQRAGDDRGAEKWPARRRRSGRLRYRTAADGSSVAPFRQRDPDLTPRLRDGGNSQRALRIGADQYLGLPRRQAAETDQSRRRPPRGELNFATPTEPMPKLINPKLAATSSI